MKRRDGTPWTDCIDCNEPESGTLPGGRCRECDIARCVDSARCRECGVFMMREEFAGPIASQHTAGCSLATSDDYRAPPTHDDVWKTAFGALYNTADDYERQAETLAKDDPRAAVLRVIVADLRTRSEQWRPKTTAAAPPELGFDDARRELASAKQWADHAWAQHKKAAEEGAGWNSRATTMEEERDEARAEVARLQRQMDHATPWRVSEPPTDDEMRAIRWRWASGPERYQADADALISAVMHGRDREAALGRDVESLRALLEGERALRHEHGKRIGWAESVAASAMRQGLAALELMRERRNNLWARTRAAESDPSAHRTRWILRIRGLTKERDEARAEAAPLRSQVWRLTDDLDNATLAMTDARERLDDVADAFGMPSEWDGEWGDRVRALRAIVEGRTVAPTDAELEAHAAAGGSWTTYGGWNAAHYPTWLSDVSYVRSWIAGESADVAGLGEPETPMRWWAHSRDRKLCAWPTGGGV